MISEHNDKGVNVRTFSLEGEKLGQVAAFVVSSEEKYGILEADLQTPKIQNTLHVT